MTSASARSARGARSTMTMKVLPPSKKSEENDRLRTLEADSERWFQEQERREANGELGKCFFGQRGGRKVAAVFMPGLASQEEDGRLSVPCWPLPPSLLLSSLPPSVPLLFYPFPADDN